MNSQALRRAVSTISMLGIATAIGAVAVFLTQTLIARELGPTAYGLFASSLATVTMVAPLAGFGLTQFRLKAYGVEGWSAHRWMRPSLRFTVFTTLLAIGAVVVWAFTGAPADDTRVYLLVLTPVILSILAIDLLSSKLRLEDRYGEMALWHLAIPVSRLMAAAALLMAPQLNGRFVAASYSAIAIVITLASLPQLRAMLRGDMKLIGHGPRVDATVTSNPVPGTVELWSQAWAYGMFAVLYPIFFQISTVLIKYLRSDAEAGIYGIALAVMTAVYLIPTTIYQKYLLSKLHRWAAHDKPKFWMVYRKGNIGMLLFGLLVGIALVVVGPLAVPIVFGEAYRGVIGILMVLSICAPIRFLSTAVGAALLTENHMRYRVVAMLVATVAVILLNVALIPVFGGMGAAVATVVGEFALLLITFYCVRRFVQPEH
ncbi:MAG TPA: polysaccharide biosynthesis C-terminal domain-containing protein [Lysobacter sp.]|nr:polysaccharide biosynthesis C-terminal domain-containing protein [Lysobacter sp.]